MCLFRALIRRFVPGQSFDLASRMLRLKPDYRCGVPNYFFSALKLLPPTRISLILTSTKLWRWPCIFLYCFLRL